MSDIKWVFSKELFELHLAETHNKREFTWQNAADGHIVDNGKINGTSFLCSGANVERWCIPAPADAVGEYTVFSARKYKRFLLENHIRYDSAEDAWASQCDMMRVIGHNMIVNNKLEYKSDPRWEITLNIIPDIKPENKEDKKMPDKYPEILIHTDGVVTHAEMRRDGNCLRVGTARCCPEDKFDYAVGVELALSRLLKKEVGVAPDEPKREWAKPGDWIRCLKHCANGFGVDKGDIVQVIDAGYQCDEGEAYYDARGGAFMYPEEYEILHDYVPPKPKFSGKVVCTSAGRGDWWTVGRIYDVKNGILVDDDGDEHDYDDSTVLFVKLVD